MYASNVVEQRFFCCGLGARNRRNELLHPLNNRRNPLTQTDTHG